MSLFQRFYLNSAWLARCMLYAILCKIVHQSQLTGCGIGESWFSCKPLEFIHDLGSIHEGRPINNTGVGGATSTECIPACGCMDGYVREYRPFYRCVPMDALLKLGNDGPCKSQEEHRQCGSCDPQCYDMTPACPYICRTGCFCRPGYVRDQNGRCILINECRSPRQVCSHNETWSACTNYKCHPSCGSRRTGPAECSAQMCVPGCVCRVGFIRKTDDPEDDCIPLAECKIEPDCGKNEKFKSCMGCSRICDPRYLDEPIICPVHCFPGCQCLPGYFRDPVKNGACVSGLECAQLKRHYRDTNSTVSLKVTDVAKCPVNMMWRSCSSECPMICTGGVLSTQPCPNTSQCVPGCHCQPGFVQDSSTAECMKQSKCIKNPGTRTKTNIQDSEQTKLDNNIHVVRPLMEKAVLDKVWTKGTNSPFVGLLSVNNGTNSGNKLVRTNGRNDADNLQSLNSTNSPILLYPIVLAENAENSPSVQNLTEITQLSCDDYKNMTYRDCISPCPEKCKKVAQNCAVHSCHGGCGCKKGFVFNEEGDCVARQDCPPHEAYDTAPKCPQNMAFSMCGNINRPSCVPLPVPLAKFACEWGCFCVSGFWMDGKGGCVNQENCGQLAALPDNLPTTPIPARSSTHSMLLVTQSSNWCPTNSEWHDCASPCQKSCRGRWHLHMDCFSPCVAGCFCRAGYVRGADGSCMEEQRCSAIDLALSAKEELHTLAEGLKYCMKKTDHYASYCRSLRQVYDMRQFCYWDSYAASCALTCCLVNF